MLTAVALGVNYNASVLLRIIASLARLADRMVGGPLFRSVKRATVWSPAMVGGGLLRIVALA
jgi:hypothetical protein